MEKMLLSSHSFRNSRLRRACTAGMTLVMALVLSNTAFGQEIQVSGTVTTPAHIPLGGVAVRVQGTDRRVLTGANGRYTVTAPTNGVLSFSRIGQKAVQETIAGRTTIDVTMDAIAFLEEVVVTAYTTEKRSDITGAVASVPVAAIERPTTASVLQRLEGSVPGVTVAASGSPGGRTTVRVRGISSFQNNDPL
jgi:TonB-dependent starch-binding outer membrane protein SusC